MNNEDKGEAALRMLKELAQDIKGGLGTHAAGLPVGAQQARLQEAYRQYSQRHIFELGDMVRLKPAICGSMRIPSEGQPAIVVEILDSPIKDNTVGVGHPDFGRLLDIRIMILIDGEKAIDFAYDSKQLEPFIDTSR